MLATQNFRRDRSDMTCFEIFPNFFTTKISSEGKIGQDYFKNIFVQNLQGITAKVPEVPGLNTYHRNVSTNAATLTQQNVKL